MNILQKITFLWIKHQKYSSYIMFSFIHGIWLPVPLINIINGNIYSISYACSKGRMINFFIHWLIFLFQLCRKVRPKMTICVFSQIMVLGLLEPVLDQIFTFVGMQYTSASFASAIMNAVPSVTFVFAVILRLERVKIKEIRSQAKVIGTLVTFAGALLMTLYKGPVIDLFFSHHATHQHAGSHSPRKHWVTGTLFLLLGCVAWSSFYILQVN